MKDSDKKEPAKLNEMDKNSIDPQCLAGIYKEIAIHVGIDMTLEIYRLFKGQQISFPTRLFDKKYIATEVAKEYENGASLKELSKKYSYTERRIRQMLGEG